MLKAQRHEDLKRRCLPFVVGTQTTSLAAAAAAHRRSPLALVKAPGALRPAWSPGPAAWDVADHFGAENPQEADDGEDETRCHWCRLPLGELTQTGPEGKRLHCECSAELLLFYAKLDEEAFRESASEEKETCRAKYGIGWSPTVVTPNHRPAAAMGCRLPPSSPGLCSVVLSKSSDADKYSAARLAPCRDPVASVNLEYLTLAMQALKLDGRAPFFSLDPLPVEDDTPDDQRLQAKTFAPAWLEGTSAGEVMFQADVYLKELSMGEHPQPVIGMRSCMDHSMDMWRETGSLQAWSGREWFLIREAQVRISEEGALLPSVVMAVQAREQAQQADGSMEDVDVTRPDHPLLKYAADFTHYFDLIAERRSVVNQLRELARATVLATFLVENQLPLQVPELWKGKAKVSGPSKIPLLWQARGLPLCENAEEEGPLLNRRILKFSGGVSMAFDDGEVVHPDDGRHSFRLHPFCARRLVPFADGTQHMPSLDELIEPTGPLAHAPAHAPLSTGKEPLEDICAVPLTSITQTKLRLMHVLLQAKGVTAPGELRYAKITRRIMTLLPSRRVVQQVPRTPEKKVVTKVMGLFGDKSVLPLNRLQDISRVSRFQPSAKGVDLHLDAGDLPAPGELEKAGPSSSSRSLACGSCFWESLSLGCGAPLELQERRFLQAIYSTQLSDRRTEGELFVPLSMRRPAYCAQLASLLGEEREATARRLAHFKSAGFSLQDPGPLFPHTWAVRRPAEAALDRKGELYERPGYTAQQVQEVLQRAVLVFEKKSEDGTIFRVYQMGKLQIRTIEEPGASEAPVALFSRLPPPGAGVPSKASQMAEHEPLIKVTEYVHYREEVQLPSFFVVLQTHSGLVLSEMLARESAPRWLEKYSLLESRLVGAKALRCRECAGSGLQLGVAIAFCASAAETFKRAPPREVNKRYADGLFQAASPSVGDELRT